MKTIAKEMLESGTLCYCWKLVLANESYGFTDHDKNLSFDGQNYEAASGFTASAIESGLGLKIDNLELSGALSSNSLNEEGITRGKFDGAEIYIHRVNWRNPNQNVLLRRGNIGEITSTRHGFRAELRGLAHKLSYPQGRVYQKLCDADFGDKRCTKNISSYSGTANIMSFAQEKHFIEVSGLNNFSSNYFNGGKLSFLDGSNKGSSFEIREHVKNLHETYLILWQAPTAPILSGDRVLVIAGCDKTYQTCKTKFQNQLNFRGFPHIPGNDYVQYYPRS